MKDFNQGRNRLRNRIEAAGDLTFLWLVQQLGVAAETNDVILTNLMTSHCFNPIPQPISFLISTHCEVDR